MRQIFKILLLALFPVMVWSQNKTIEVTYVKGYKNFKDTTDRSPKIIKNLEYQLLCNTNEARFEYIPSMSNDGDNTSERFIGRSGGRGIYYKNLKDKVKFRQLESMDDENIYLIHEELSKYNWELLKETKKILGYNCFKAIGSYKEYNPRKKEYVTIRVEAWYAPSLPLSFGPAGHDGLPGLVLESYVASFSLIANDIRFHDTIVEIKRPKKGKEVTRDEYTKISYEGWLKLRRSRQ